MEIIEKNYRWSGYLSKRNKTDTIVVHHAAAANCSPDDIHRIHLMNAWAGIGYHFYIRKDGSIYRGRPINTIGAHVSGNNSNSIGICFEGNFEKEEMTSSQLASGKELILYLKGIYPSANVKKHCDLNSTACPGRNFPFEKMIKAEFETSEDIINELGKRGIMTNISLWSKKCADDTNAYWLARKICNMTKTASARANILESVNDIVWELNYRGIITDKPLWLKLFKEDIDLYWLGFKAANYTSNKEGTV